MSLRTITRKDVTPARPSPVAVRPGGASTTNDFRVDNASPHGIAAAGGGVPGVPRTSK